MNKYLDVESNLDYSDFIADLNSHRLEHYARMIEQTNCTILVSFCGEVDIGIHVEYNKWCNANCNGKYYVYNENYVFFKDEADAMAFKLRWC